MSEATSAQAPTESDRRVVVIGPDGIPVGPGEMAHGQDGSDGATAAVVDPGEAIGEPAKVMRVGTMIKQLLEEVRAAPLDDASRIRLKNIHAASIRELETGLTPELREELERLTLPFTEDSVPSDAELRIAQAQLVGWLEGVFHGLQTALMAQQLAARAQLEQIRRGVLPPGTAATENPAAGPGTGQYL